MRTESGITIMVDGEPTLVPDDVIDPEKGSASARPLCKGAETYGWSDKFAGGQPDCEKCIKAASAQGVLV